MMSFLLQSSTSNTQKGDPKLQYSSFLGTRKLVFTRNQAPVLLLATIPELFFPPLKRYHDTFCLQSSVSCASEFDRFCLYGSSFFSHRMCHQMMLFLFLELSIIHILQERALFHLSVWTNDVIFLQSSTSTHLR